ncbi:glycosyltransferase family 39 protein [Usitatibacter palustris]|uniref:Glycosyltransferase RgtA/B/C/D-like domain-containing protein n=1 Tax=Usitatibacter palustris TaxID=2732487 RepID=A0A6M4HAU8_9PROT|nr:glycosyltransferase family 39 protein [Usitatibacter palustris]QJR15564.1 hypothetical protein DSM104440_02386 [Usitatibacter palustris]
MRRVRSPYVWFALPLAFVLGAWLRIDQLSNQVLIEDEWHPVHQVIYYSWLHVFGSFGNADYSIPLTAWYYALANAVGVSELDLRIPPLMAGIYAVVLIPWWLRRSFDTRAIAILGFLLAVSPFLISYSRIARSYALTLLGVYAALWCLQCAIRNAPEFRWCYGVAYSVLCGLVAWAHPITGPLLVAPLAFLAWGVWRGNGIRWATLVKLTALAGVCMAVFVLPPLLHDPAALAGKSGRDQIGVDTIVGAWHLWIGTGSSAVAAIALVLAALGIGTAVRRSHIVRWVVAGATLTVVALFVTQPWWINQPLAFGRYLLAVVPVVLLAIALGMLRVGDGIRRLWRGRAAPRPAASLLALPVALLAWWPTSPHPDLLHEPNSYTQHSYFQLDYRVERNPVRKFLPTLPKSGLWNAIAAAPPESLTIAVAPFRYATYEWPAPYWELIGHQRVIPAFLWGTCEATRYGEVPPDSRFRFQNAVHVSSEADLLGKQVAYLAYFKGKAGLSEPLPKCEAWMRTRFGPPHFEDEVLAIWDLGN